ncbi:hypothetical protein SDC9_60153 [bioreactor metagenome]|uniref:Filament cap protein n=1 Tax=bioreactor metagenome TaxID=1076179 RepID=A0A644XI62_9ZZZZ
MPTRITGLATGMDIDSVVKQTMQAYRTKIDTQQQKKDVLEIKQKLYRDIVKEAQSLYNTHFDILKSGSLVRASTWQSIKFTSNSDSLKVTGDSSAKLGNYAITGESAKAATITKTESEVGSEITINGQKFKVEGSTAKEKAVNLNNALTKAGINVSVRYTDFASDTQGINKQAFIFESKLLGKDNNFVIGGTPNYNSTVTGENAKAAEITRITVDMLKNNAVSGQSTFKIGEKEITIDVSGDNNAIKNNLNTALSNNNTGFTTEVDNSGNIKFISNEAKSGQVKPNIEIKNQEGIFEEVSIGFTDGKDESPAEIVLNSTALNKSITINGSIVDLSKLGENATKEDIIKAINGALGEGSSVKAQIIDDNIVLKTKSDTGETAKITLSVPDDNGTIYGKDATSSEITGLKVSDLISNIVSGKVTFKIDNNEISIDIAETSTNEDIEKLLNTALSGKGYNAKIDEGNIILTTTTTGGTGQKPPVIAFKKENSEGNEIFEEFKGITFTSGKDATSAKVTLNSADLNKPIVINGIAVDLTNIDAGSTNESKAEYINKILSNQKIPIRAEVKGDNIVLTSNLKGESSKITLSSLDKGTPSQGGKDANIVINNGMGTYTHTGNTNSFTLDGITFNFTGEIPSEGIKVTSSQDSTEIVEKVKKYIEDYNALIEKLNTLTNEKRDRSYQPLTKDQKDAMSDKEIELWESKVQKGQLRRDSDLMRITNSLKQGMRTLVTGAGLTLKDIGIESVEDYGGTKDGTYRINEDTLKKAIENDTESVSKLFMQSPQSGVSESEGYNQKGIMMRLKDILNNETVSSKSVLAKKAGFEGTTTIITNTLTKTMEQYQNKIDQMEDLFSQKEQALYNKYAKLESIMNSYNSQMTYLSQSLGLGTS